MDPQAAQDQAMMGMYIGVGVLILFVIIMIIVIPKQIRKAKARGQQAAVDQGKEMKAKTGLDFSGNGFQGEYKGYQVNLVKSLGNNSAAINDAKRDMVSDFIFGDDGDNEWEDLHDRSTVFPIIKVWLTAPGQNFPDVTFFQTSNFFLSTDEYRNNRINGRIPDEQKLDLDADDLHKRADFYGDAQGAQKMLKSAELRRLMSSWVYPDIRAEGQQVILELNHSNIINKWGYKKTSGTEYLVQALDICVATADALKQ
jgi:hypothetical protein